MDERQPVDPTEAVYRRIPRALCHPGLPVAFRMAAFRPPANDATGLSVFRTGFLRPEDTLANVDPAKRSTYYVARLAVADLLGLNLTVIPDPDPNGPPGHALIPELSWSAYNADKTRWKPVLLELARLAGAAIVHQAS